MTMHSLLSQAAALFREGRWSEALPAYEALLKSHPRLPDSWYNLAIVQRAHRKFEEALDSYAIALKFGVGRPEEVHLQRGVIYADDLHDGTAALKEIEAALRLNPEYIPALLNLGNHHEDYGERDLALSAYEHVLALNPRHALALARCLPLWRISKIDDVRLIDVQSRLQDQSLGVEDATDLGFALGGVLDALGEYDAAFAVLRQANDVREAQLRRSGHSYDRAAMEKFVDQIIAAKLDTGAVSEPDFQPPLFICGMFRSGSTLVEHTLGRHQGVVAGGELATLPALENRFAIDQTGRTKVLDNDVIKSIRLEYKKELDRLAKDNSLVTDKRPDNLLRINLLKSIFPTAKIIYTTRNLLDNALSLYFLHASDEINYSFDIDNIFHYIKQERRLIRHWKRCFPSDILIVRYEDVVKDPVGTFQKVSSFAGLPWDENLLHGERDRAAVRTASNWQVRAPIHSAAVNRWRNYERHLKGACNEG